MVEKEKGEEMRKGCDLSPRPSQIPIRGRCGKGAGHVMAVAIFHGKATFVSGGISFSPFGETGEGFFRFALQSRHAD
jgi:hypothetical protein